MWAAGQPHRHQFDAREEYMPFQLSALAGASVLQPVYPAPHFAKI